MARPAVAVDNSETKIERYEDVNAGLAELMRDMRRAQEEFKYTVKTVNLDNAGPMNVEKRRKLYQDPIKAFKKAVGEAFERFATGML